MFQRSTFAKSSEYISQFFCLTLVVVSVIYSLRLYMSYLFFFVVFPLLWVAAFASPPLVKVVSTVLTFRSLHWVPEQSL